MNEKKKYVKPEAEVVDFTSEDIVTTSVNEVLGDGGTDNEELW